jgi:hypothetical protein
VERCVCWVGGEHVHDGQARADIEFPEHGKMQAPKARVLSNPLVVVRELTTDLPPHQLATSHAWN